MPEMFSVRSVTDPEIHHTVYVEDGEMECSCPAGMRSKPCRHVRIIQELKELEDFHAR